MTLLTFTVFPGFEPGLLEVEEDCSASHAIGRQRSSLIEMDTDIVDNIRKVLVHLSMCDFL